MRVIVAHWLAFPLLKMSASDMNVHEEPVLCILYNAVEYARMCVCVICIVGSCSDAARTVGLWWLLNLTYQQESGQQHHCGHC